MAFGFFSLIRNFTLRDRQPWATALLETWAGKPVTPDTAMQVATVMACVRTVSQIIATLPVKVFETLPDGSRAVVADHPASVLLRQTPNSEQTPAEFLEGMLACLLIYGNAYAHKTVSNGQVRALTILMPEMVMVRRLDDGSIQYACADPKGRAEFSEDEIWHLKGFGFGGLLGLSPIRYGAQSLSTAIAADEVAGRMFSNGMKPSGWLTYDGTLKPDQREQARKALVEPYTGSGNAAKVGILEAGFKWASVSIPSVDAELLASRRWHVEELCRLFCNVPPILIGHASQGQTMWGTGVEQVMLGWLTTGLDPLLVKIEQSMRRALVPVAERSRLYVEFVREGLLRADTVGRAEAYSKLLQVGAMTPNQIADRENLPRFDGGDVHLVNSTLVPLHLAGQRPARVQPAPGEPIPEGQP